MKQTKIKYTDLPQHRVQQHEHTEDGTQHSSCDENTET